MTEPIGPTGRFPDGKKLVPGDQGELRCAVMAKDGFVQMHFGSNITWLALTPDQARAFGGALIQKAAEIESGRVKH